MYEAGIAMSGLSCFINVDLARDLAHDIMTLVRNKLTFFFVYLNKNNLDDINKTLYS